MREMDPSKHIPIDDRLHTKPDRKLQRPLRIIFFLVLSILYTLGLVFYLDYYYSENDSLIWDQNATVGEINNNTGSEQLVNAKKLIEDGMAKWDDLEYVEYSVRGSDGDENAYMEYHYKMDIVNDEYDFTSYDPCLGGEGPMPCMQVNRYVSKDGEIVNNVNGKNKKLDEFTLSFTLNEIKEMISAYLDENQLNNYEMDVKIVEGVYGLENQPVKFVNINYYRQPSGNAFADVFKVYADVILDKYSIEVILNSEGNILEAKVPYIYDEILILFSSYNEPIDITLPEEE